MEEEAESEYVMSTESESISLDSSSTKTPIPTTPTTNGNATPVPTTLIPTTPTNTIPAALTPSTSVANLSTPTSPADISACTDTQKPKKQPLPYQSVIDALEKLNTTKTPVEKLDCLTKAASGILTCVDEFYADKTQHILMGAEDKFPVLIYAIIRANIDDLFSNIAFLQDFITNNIGDEESKYRTSELTDAISYIQSLDWELRDANGVLVPLKMIISSVTWSAKGVEKLKIDATDPDGVRSQILFCLSTLFRLVGNQKDNLFSPIQVPSKFVPLIQRFESFFYVRVYTQRSWSQIISKPR